MDNAADISNIVKKLKIERDTWEAVANEYKAAFESQTARLKELQNICFATQAELENERVHHNRPSTASHDQIIESRRDDSFGSALILAGSNSTDRKRQISDECSNPLFARVQHAMQHRNYGTALTEIEKLLRGPMSSKARCEGLLLKSCVLKAAGPEEIYEALAACSEAMEFCHRLSELEEFLPRIQCQRAVLYCQLRMLHRTQDTLKSESASNLSMTAVHGLCRCCDEVDGAGRGVNRRSGFDEHRTFSEGLVAHLGKGIDNKRRHSSAQFRMRAAAKAKRMSLPHRWVGSKHVAA